MNDKQLVKSFSKMINYKIKFRNIQASKSPVNTYYVDFLDREINFLQSIQELLVLNNKLSEVELIKAQAKAFDSGVVFGKLQERFLPSFPTVVIH